MEGDSILLLLTVGEMRHARCQYTNYAHRARNVATTAKAFGRDVIDSGLSWGNFPAATLSITFSHRAPIIALKFCAVSAILVSCCTYTFSTCQTKHGRKAKSLSEIMDVLLLEDRNRKATDPPEQERQTKECVVPIFTRTACTRSLSCVLPRMECQNEVNPRGLPFPTQPRSS